MGRRGASDTFDVERVAADAGPVPDATEPLRDEPRCYEWTDEELGRGGLGVVRVVRDHALDREVAAKQLLEAPGGGSREARFLREARITALLDHPGVAPIHEIGRRLDGSLYYTMRRIRGRTLSALIAAAPGPDARRALVAHVVAVAQTVAYAHSRGVLHRDLKPQNVMVGPWGETIVLDWGLARLVGEADAPAAGGQEPAAALTHAGRAFGTPQYMSPEQARGLVGEIDERSDVWGLGAVLCEVLSGTPPHTGATSGEIVERAANGPPRTVRDRVPSGDHELCAIADKALAYHPADRYPTAAAFLADLQAWKEARPVSAVRYGVADHARRFAARHQARLLLAASVLAFVAVGATVAAARVGAARDHALDAAQAAGRALERSRLSTARLLVEHAERAAELGDASRSWLLAGEALALYEEVDEPEGRARARGLALDGASGWVPRFVRSSRVEDVDCVPVAWSPDARLVAVGCRGGAWLGEAGTWSPIPCGHDAAVRTLAFSADGRYLVIGHYAPGTLDRWDVAANSPAGPPVSATTGNMDAVVATGGSSFIVRFDGTLAPFDAATGVLGPSTGPVSGYTTFAAHLSGALAWAQHPDQVFAMPWGRPPKELRTRVTQPGALALSPDASLVAVAGSDYVLAVDAIELCEVAGGECTHAPAGARGGVVGVAFHPRRPWLLAASGDGTVRAWHTSTGDLLGAARACPTGACREIATGMALSHDGASLAVATQDGAVVELSLVDTRTSLLPASAAPREGLPASGYFHGDEVLVDYDLSRWEVGTGNPLPPRAWPEGAPEETGFRPLGTDLFGVMPERAFALWDAGTGRRRASGLAAGRLWAMASGGDLVALGVGAELVVLGRADLAPRYRALVAPPGRNVLSVAMLTDGSRVVAMSTSGVVSVHDPRARRETARAAIEEHGLRLLDVALSPDGERVATGDQSGRIHRFRLTIGGDTDSLDALPPIDPRAGAIQSLAWTEHGLVAALADGTARLWDDAGTLVAVFPRGTSAAFHLDASDDGAWLLRGDTDGGTRLTSFATLGASPASLIDAVCARTGLQWADGAVVRTRSCRSP